MKLEDQVTSLELSKKLKETRDPKSQKVVDPSGEELREKAYRMEYTCSNCHRSFTQEFYFGQVASQGTCPYCGVSPADFDRRWEHKL